VSVKYFCDLCDRELTEATTPDGGFNGVDRLGTSLQRPNRPMLKVEVMTFKGQTANDGHWCKYCVLDALYKLDDRPQPAPCRCGGMRT
jgi:hypothetical protein